MQVEITGKVIQVLPTQSGQGRNGEWMKNAFVIEWSDNGYKQHLCLDVMGADKWEKMEKAVRVGNDVLVRFSVSSREWSGRWFTTANCYYCSTVGGSHQQSSRPTNDPAYSVPDNQSAPPDNALPF